MSRLRRIRHNHRETSGFVVLGAIHKKDTAIAIDDGDVMQKFQPALT